METGFHFLYLETTLMCMENQLGPGQISLFTCKAGAFREAGFSQMVQPLIGLSKQVVLLNKGTIC
jgi:hypothetical protein